MVPEADRCSCNCERKIKGKRYVAARWRCPRRKLKGLPYCGYHEPWDKKQTRLATLREKKRENLIDRVLR